jgi:hypothetical protein
VNDGGAHASARGVFLGVGYVAVFFPGSSVSFYLFLLRVVDTLDYSLSKAHV